MDYHSKFQEIRKKYGYSYRDISEITGLNIGTINNLLGNAGKFPNWLKLFVHFAETVESKRGSWTEEESIVPKEKQNKPLTSNQIQTMVNKNKSSKL